MNPELNTWLQLLFRWGHVIAGIIWIGHLYFFNWVNGPLAKALDGPTKKIVVPQLMPRALFWFRWGAAWTWITGVLLLGLVYYHGHPAQVFDADTGQNNNPWLWLAIVLVTLAIGFVVYNVVMKKVANVIVANCISMLLFAGVYLLLEYVGHFSGRALFLHAGAIFGTTMALNVWMIIWPYQQKIINAVKEGGTAEPMVLAQAGLRSRHNTFMSVPLVFAMLSNHYPTVYASPYRDFYLAGIIIVGFIATSMLYSKAPKVQGF